MAASITMTPPGVVLFFAAMGGLTRHAPVYADWWIIARKYPTRIGYSWVVICSRESRYYRRDQTVATWHQ